MCYSFQYFVNILKGCRVEIWWKAFKLESLQLSKDVCWHFTIFVQTWTWWCNRSLRDSHFGIKSFQTTQYWQWWGGWWWWWWWWCLTWAVFVSPDHFWGPGQVKDHKFCIVRLGNNGLKNISGHISETMTNGNTSWFLFYQNISYVQWFNQTTSFSLMASHFFMIIVHHPYPEEIVSSPTSFSFTAVCILLTLEFSLQGIFFCFHLLEK